MPKGFIDFATNNQAEMIAAIGIGMSQRSAETYRTVVMLICRVDGAYYAWILSWGFVFEYYIIIIFKNYILYVSISYNRAVYECWNK